MSEKHTSHISAKKRTQHFRFPSSRRDSQLRHPRKTKISFWDCLIAEEDLESCRTNKKAENGGATKIGRKLCRTKGRTPHDAKSFRSMLQRQKFFGLSRFELLRKKSATTSATAATAAASTTTATTTGSEQRSVRKCDEEVVDQAGRSSVAVTTSKPANQKDLQATEWHCHRRGDRWR